MRLHIALTQTPLSILNYQLIRVVSACKGLDGDTKNEQQFSGNFGKNGGLCRPTIASALVAIKVIWVVIRQRPSDLRIRVTVIAFYKRSVGKI